ncbi:MAG: gliding motility protein GldN [Bacteroidota bacterium]|nr:gliding motility protein GldN [Bacteroidota bacterium]MDP3145134.1 gliding motility protein GldN [Bacteroidota bacterium]
MKGGVGSPGNYSEYNVKDCFLDSFFYSGFKSKPFKSNYILKGSTIWRTVDLENKQNKLLLSTDKKCEQISLIEIIKFGLFDKKLNAFYSDNFSEAEKTVMSSKQLSLTLSYKDSSEFVSFDSNGNETKNLVVEKRYLIAKDIVNFLIKEDWIINSYSGQLEKFIIAIAPLVRDKRTDKAVPLFWLYYSEWEGLFNAFIAKNYLSDQKITYKDVFEKNYFSSQISKEINLFDRPIKSVHRGQDSYLESEIIKEKIKNFESDLFQN